MPNMPTSMLIHAYPFSEQGRQRPKGLATHDSQSTTCTLIHPNLKIERPTPGPKSPSPLLLIRHPWRIRSSTAPPVSY